MRLSIAPSALEMLAKQSKVPSRTNQQFLVQGTCENDRLHIQLFAHVFGMGNLMDSLIDVDPGKAYGFATFQNNGAKLHLRYNNGQQKDYEGTISYETLERNQD